MLKNYESMEFKLVWDYNPGNNSQVIEKTTITVSSYSHKLGFIAVGGVEGRIRMFDQSAKVKMA